LLWTTIHTTKVIFLAYETNAFVLFRAQRLGVIVISGVHPLGAKLGAQTAGDTTGVSSDGVFAYGIAKPRCGFHGFLQVVLPFVRLHVLSQS
jgi:hypothetical protein